ncbi:amidohydrolase, partial [Micrococcus luteus]|nr:amidohydrolase [Micrococcus luteus]
MTTSDSVLTGPRPTSVPSVGPVVAELEDEIVSFRRDLHRHPELSYEEYRTTDRIVELLSGYGFSPVRMESTGAYVDVGEGPVVLALRADIDALPVEEETGLPYVSVNDGV